MPKTSTTLFKYRSLRPMEYVLDILLNERLHCAPYSELNDPFEGMFFSYFYSRPQLFTFVKPGAKIRTPRTVKDLRFSVAGSRICSLSATLSDVRLWSYYSDGHQGIAIEIDFSSATADLKKVSYVPELHEYSPTLLGSPSPEEVLSFKTVHWSYEQEYRIIQEEEFYPIHGLIRAVYTGIHVSSSHCDLLKKIMPAHIPIVETKLNPHTLKIEPSNTV